MIQPCVADGGLTYPHFLRCGYGPNARQAQRFESDHSPDVFPLVSAKSLIHITWQGLPRNEAG